MAMKGKKNMKTTNTMKTKKGKITSQPAKTMKTMKAKKGKISSQPAKTMKTMKAKNYWQRKAMNKMKDNIMSERLLNKCWQNIRGFTTKTMKTMKTMKATRMTMKTMKTMKATRMSDKMLNKCCEIIRQDPHLNRLFMAKMN